MSVSGETFTLQNSYTIFQNKYRITSLFEISASSIFMIYKDDDDPQNMIKIVQIDWLSIISPSEFSILEEN